MSIGPLIQAWRIARNHSIESLAGKTGIKPTLLEDIEADHYDPPASTMEALATALRVPTPWLFQDPQSFQFLFDDENEEEGAAGPRSTQIDPVTERILAGSRVDRSLYVLLTALMQAGDPRLLRAAEMSLRSLVKQSRQATVPWQQRPSGHFEPPSD